MNYTSPDTLRLLARSEGKIKSYESCHDIRAWSHDLAVRDRYLRDWMKRDTPLCVIPVRAWANLFETMTYKCRGRTPRCHPDCKSKIVLDTICTSCHAMKECLKNNEKFEKYFVDEELETSNWPCDRCLDALKSIKLFWKVIVEKVFNINMSKNDHLVKVPCCDSDSVRNVAKVWKQEMVRQTMLVKEIVPKINHSISKTSCSTKAIKTVRIAEPYGVEESGDCPLTVKPNKIKRNNTGQSVKKVCRCTSVKVKVLDVGCDAASVPDVSCNKLCNVCNVEELKSYRTRLEYLQQQYNVQSKEIEALKKENISLKTKLERFSPQITALCSPSVNSNDKNVVALVPKPYETCVENCTSDPKDIDSEMIITMKNCSNECYKHVSLLQVLHKTNDPLINDEAKLEGLYFKKEDPINLLTKVQTTLGAMVKREICLADKNPCCKKLNIEATFQKVNPSKPAASSCSRTSSCWATSDSNFVSVNSEQIV